MGLGAIVVVDADHGILEDPRRSLPTKRSGQPDGSAEPLSFVELFGASLLEHTIARFAKAEVEVITLLVQTEAFRRIPTFRESFANINIQVADEIWASVAVTLKDYAENGIQYAFIAKPSAYTEADLMDLLDFHRQRHRTITRASDRDGALDFWVVGCDATWQASISGAGSTEKPASDAAPSYFVKEYTKRVGHLRDFRQLATDAFLGRCQIRPVGQQIRPGVWAEEGVGIGRGARIVAPAYLGRRSEIRENTLITRFSNIESCCYVDYGTAIEDTSVLPNTYIGIWLDVRHSVVQGNKLLNLKRNVQIEISDPSLIRSNPLTQDVRNKTSVMSLV